MQIPHPPAVGNQRAVKDLRSVLFSEPILGAAGVRPQGYLKLIFVHLLPLWARLLVRPGTGSLPPTPMYLAVTPSDIRLFSKPGFGSPFEVGRWPRGSYRASSGETRLGLRLDFELERLGRVRVYAGRDARPVFDLIVQSASGPVI